MYNILLQSENVPYQGYGLCGLFVTVERNDMAKVYLIHFLIPLSRIEICFILYAKLSILKTYSKDITHVDWKIHYTQNAESILISYIIVTYI